MSGDVEAKALGSRLRRLRELERLSVKEAAKRAGISLGAWESYELGRSSPGRRAVVKVGEEFGVSLDWLLAGRGPMRRMEGGLTGEQREQLREAIAMTHHVVVTRSADEPPVDPQLVAEMALDVWDDILAELDRQRAAARIGPISAVRISQMAQAALAQRDPDRGSGRG